MKQYSNRHLANLFKNDNEGFNSWRRAVETAMFQDAPGASNLLRVFDKIALRKNCRHEPLREYQNCKQRRRSRR